MRNKGLKRLMVCTIIFIVILSSSLNVFAVGNQDTVAPKYVFMFIGDGLGSAQRQIAQLYQGEVTKNPEYKLTMNKLEVFGINTTYSADQLVTDSAAAGTALATGCKTNNGVIAKSPEGKDLKTLVEACEEKGIATGLVSTTRLTHATPAAFATHNISRGNENEIAVDYLDSGVDFIAGGGNRHFLPQDWKWGKSKRKDDRNILSEFAKKGYKVFESKEKTKEFRGYVPEKEDKVIATFTYTHMPYEIDRMRDNEVPSLAEMTEKGIDVLSKYDKGFFMMVEGGRIDHACHANDAAGSIHDTLAFDKAIDEAMKFYNNHKDETLILVVGDHETGGMGLGFGLNYFLKLEELTKVKVSVEDVLAYGAGAYKAGADRNEYFTYLEANYGLINLTEDEKNEITKSMDMIDKGLEGSKLQYGYLTEQQVAASVANIISKRTNIEWTTFAHSATSIPMSAIGVKAQCFAGYKDNTEIAKTMADVLGLVIGK